MRLRKLLRKIHRWIGLLAALWLLQLAITGLLLQHAGTFKLTTAYVQSPTILQWFDYGKRQQAWDDGGQVVFQIDDAVKINDSIIKIPEPLKGVVTTGEQWILATSSQLMWLNQQGEIINQLDEFDGMPMPVEQLSYHHQTVHLLSANTWYQVTDDVFEPVTLSNNVVNKPRPLTQSEQQRLFSELLGHTLSYDKVIHAIHSGIKSSSWLNTLSALALLYLCFSGIYLFFKAPRKKEKIQL